MSKPTIGGSPGLAESLGKAYWELLQHTKGNSKVNDEAPPEHLGSNQQIRLSTAELVPSSGAPELAQPLGREKRTPVMGLTAIVIDLLWVSLFPAVVSRTD
jgi:hypothetical protein